MIPPPPPPHINIDRSLGEENKAFWSKKIKSLLEHIGLGDLWMKAHYGDIGIINIIRQRLKDIELQRWLGKIDNDTRKDANQGNKMRTYRKERIPRSIIILHRVWFRVECLKNKNYNFLACDWFKKVLFSTNSLAKLLSDSLLLDSLLLDSLFSDSSISQSHSKM